MHASIFIGRYGSRTPVFGYPFNALMFFRFLPRSIFPFFHDLPYDRDVRQRQCRNENYQGDYPIESTHKIHSVRKAERACRGIPIQEKVRVIIAHTEIPIQRIAYAGKDQVIQRRYPGIKELFIFQIAFSPTKKSAMDNTGTATCVRIFAGAANASGIVGANTPQNTTPVNVMDTVNTYFTIHNARGIPFRLRTIDNIVNTAATSAVAPIQILDWTVKYNIAVAPPINPPEAITAVRVTPAITLATIANSKTKDMYFFIFKLYHRLRQSTKNNFSAL